MRERTSGGTLDSWAAPKTLNQRDNSAPAIGGLADYLFHILKNPHSILIVPFGPHPDPFAVSAGGFF